PHGGSLLRRRDDAAGRRCAARSRFRPAPAHGLRPTSVLRPVALPFYLEHLVFLVSSIDLPVEVDSLPLHVVGREPLATERQVAQLVLEQPALQKLYGGWLATLHPAAWKEI